MLNLPSIFFSNFSCMFLFPLFFFNLNLNCSSNLLYLRNLKEQVKKAFRYQKLFWPFTVPTNCSSDLKIFAKLTTRNVRLDSGHYTTKYYFYPDDSEYLKLEFQVSSISESSGLLPKTFQQQPYLPNCQSICH